MERIIYLASDGNVAVITPVNTELSIEQIAAKDVPDGMAWQIVKTQDLPQDRIFRNAWAITGQAIGCDIPKAKQIAHVLRRRARDQAFAPLDIQATIPSQAAKAEADRAAIRTQDAALQESIDAALTETELRALLP